MSDRPLRFAPLLITALIAMAPVETIRASLLGFYNFDNAGARLADTSGNNRTLSIAGNTNPRWAATNGFNNSGAYLFTEDRLTCPLNVSPGTYPLMSWGAWVRTDSLSGRPKILGHDNSGWDRAIGLDERILVAGEIETGAWRFTSFMGTNAASTGPLQGLPAPINKTNWAFVCAVYNQTAQTVTMYVDLDATSTNDAPIVASGTGTFGSGASTFAIGGARPDSGSEAWEGAIDNVFIYDEALSSDAVTALRDSFSLPSVPRINSFRAVPGFVSGGSPTSLQWNVSDASYVSINNGAPAISGATGSVNVTPGATTTYTITATNAQGSATAQVTVGVNVSPLAPRLNEFMASNGKTLDDGDGNSSDWIEIFNPNPYAINLGGYVLQDSSTNWVFPSVQLEGNKFLVVFASDKTVTNYVDAGGSLHTTFGLSSAGETLRLLAPGGVTVVSQFTNVPAQRTDVSWGLGANGTNGYLLPPTPGASNGPALLGFVSDTKFFPDRGFYTNAISITITSATVNASIIYTTNGTEPTLLNGIVVTPPLGQTPIATVLVSRTTLLRAAAFRTNWVATGVDTHTYLFVTNALDQPTNPPGLPMQWGKYTGITTSGITFTNGQPIPADYAMNPTIVNVSRPAMMDALRALPTLSIVGHQDDFFSVNGILPNPFADVDGTGVYTTNPYPVDRRCSVEWIQPDGTREFQINCAVRLVGGFSRHYESAFKKSLRISFSDEYGADELNFPLFGTNEVSRFEQVQLRATFSDGWVDNAVPAQFARDNFVRETYLLMGQPSVRGTYVHLYINGLYWGIYNPSERPDADYAASHYGGTKDDYDALKHLGLHSATANPPQDQFEVIDGTSSRWQTALDLTAGDMSTSNLYNQVASYVNMTTLADYYLLNTFLANYDWPHKNWYAFGRKDGSDGGYRILPWDSEYSLHEVGRNVVNSTNYLRTPGRFMGRARLNAEFRMLFADRVHKHAYNDGPLTTASMTNRYFALTSIIEPAIDAEAARWGDNSSTRHGVKDFRKSNWLTSRANILNNFFPQRPAIAINQYRTNGLYPSYDAPEFTQHGGVLNSGVVSFRFLPGGTTIYYTTNGADPRLPGGGVNPQALTLGAPAVQPLIDFQATDWRYLVIAPPGLSDSQVTNGSPPHPSYSVGDWKHPDFDDSAWPSGQAMLGFGDITNHVINTTIGFGGNANNKYTTTYFRRAFEVSDPAVFQSLIVDIVRDDGAIVYVNGHEIGRSNLGAGNRTYANLAADSNPEDAVINFNFPLAPGVLRTGTNIVAVELHQATLNSSDLGIDLQLLGFLTNNGTSFMLPRSATVKVRALSGGGEWSALTEAFFNVGAIAQPTNYLVISELNYNPHPPVTPAELAVPGVSADSFEFIEFLNTHPSADMDLTGVQIVEGVTFTFGNVVLAPGQRVLVVRSTAGMTARYGAGLNIAGQFSGGLNNSGERILVRDALGNEILSFTYGNSGLWDSAANGAGRTLVLANPSGTSRGELGKSYSWSGGAAYGGSPGSATGTNPVPPAVVINEILAHTDLPQKDSIELFNRSTNTVNLGGWYLSDSGSRPLKYRIANNTLLAPGGYLVFNEDHFNPTPLTPGTNDFRLSASYGSDIYLTIGTSNGLAVQSFVDHVTIGASFNGQAIGRWPNGTGRLTPLSALTLGTNNAPPNFGPIIISEVNYNPPAPSPAALAILPTMTGDDLEFVEIYHAGTNAVNLTNWRLRGEADFDFATGTILNPGAALTVIGFNPTNAANATKLAAFRAHYGLSAGVPLVGSLSGKLSNSEGRVTLERPDAPPPEDPTFYPRILADELIYNDLAPWSLTADGLGDSLHRAQAQWYGHVATSWWSRTATPGVGSFVPAPVLDIYFTAGSGGASATLRWTSQSGATYSIRQSYDLRTWTDLETALPSGGALTTYDVSPGGPTRFFQVGRNP